MAWFLRAVQDDNDQWTCRRGLQLLDQQPGQHEHVDDALTHLRDVAQEIEGAVQVMMHFLDGTVRPLGPGEA